VQIPVTLIVVREERSVKYRRTIQLSVSAKHVTMDATMK